MKAIKITNVNFVGDFFSERSSVKKHIHKIHDDPKDNGENLKKHIFKTEGLQIV